MSTYKDNGLGVLLRGRYLRERRRACNLLVTDMARCLDVDPCTVWRWESERVVISRQKLYEYLTACRLGVQKDIDRVLDGLPGHMLRR